MEVEYILSGMYAEVEEREEEKRVVSLEPAKT
jgi:hypothetical protein